jgi:hypothetical protein
VNARDGGTTWFEIKWFNEAVIRSESKQLDLGLRVKKRRVSWLPVEEGARKVNETGC